MSAFKMGQKFSHKSVLWSRPSCSLFVSGISQKTALWAPKMVGECHLCRTPAVWGPGAAHPDTTAAPSSLPATSFSGKPERRGRCGGWSSEADIGSPHTPLSEGSWAPHSSWCHLLNTWPLHAGDATFPQLPEELARRRLKIWKCAVSSCFKIAKLAVASQPSNTYLSCHTQVHSSPATC